MSNKPEPETLHGEPFACVLVAITGLVVVGLGHSEGLLVLSVLAAMVWMVFANT